MVSIAGIIIICTAVDCLAAPSESMRKAMKTPVSVFDFVLFQIAYELKFVSVDGRHSYLNDIDYDQDDDLIQLKFVMPRSHMRFFVFKNSDEQRKERILRAEVEILNTYIVRLIKNLPIRTIGDDVEFNEDEFKADLIKRLTITLNTFDPGKVVTYEVTRNPSGDISFSRHAPLDQQNGGVINQ